MHLYRVIVPVGNIEQAARFYGRLLASEGERVSINRHYFDCGGVLLACLEPRGDGAAGAARPRSEHLYLSTEEPLESVRERALAAGAAADRKLGAIDVQPWGERSFYLHDPWGNPLCIVQAGTEYRTAR